MSSMWTRRPCWWCGSVLAKLGVKTLSDGRKVHTACLPYASRAVKHETRPYSAIPPGTRWGQEND